MPHPPALSSRVIWYHVLKRIYRLDPCMRLYYNIDPLQV